MKHILPTIHISDSKPFKTPKDGSTPLDALMPFYNLQITNDSNDKLILKSENINIPISNLNFLELISSVSTTNGIINEPCAILSEDSSLYIIKYHSEEYNQLRLEYETSLNKLYLKKKDIQIGDSVTILKGKQEIKDITYLGEIFFLPILFLFYNRDDVFYNRRIKSFSYHVEESLTKKLLFAKIENQQIVDFYLFSSFPKTISSDTQQSFISLENIIFQMNYFLERNYMSFISKSNEHENLKESDSSYYIKTDQKFYEGEIPKNQFISTNFGFHSLNIYFSEPTFEEALEDSLNKLGSFSKRKKEQVFCSEINPFYDDDDDVSSSFFYSDDDIPF